MACVRTGADVYLSQYGCVVHCDIHKFNNVFVLRVAGNPVYGERQTHTNELLEILEWFDKDSQVVHKTIIGVGLTGEIYE